MSTTHLTLEFKAADGSTITPNSARLIDANAQLAASFADDGPRGFACAISALASGNYRLRVNLPNYPTLVFSVTFADKSGKRSVGFGKHTPKCCTLASKQASEGDATSPILSTASFTLGPAYEELVLVAGWDYSGGSDNTKWCTAWRDDLYAGKTSITGSKTSITQVVHDYTVVSMFDFKSGKRLRWIKAQTGWHLMDEELQGTIVTHLGSYDSVAHNTKRHADDSISIIHVYDHIERLGDQAPGSVVGLHVFSHAWAGGPILVNTSQGDEFNRGARSNERDPGDKDGRAKDFTSTNMPGLAKFKAAFAAGASAKIWGCFATTVYRNMVRAAHGAGANKSKKHKFKVGDVTVEMNATEIEDFFRNQVFANAYMSQLATAAGIPVHGAPPGMGANLRQVNGNYYMFVDQSSYKKEFAWYESALGKLPDISGHFSYP